MKLQIKKNVELDKSMHFPVHIFSNDIGLANCNNIDM